MGLTERDFTVERVLPLFEILGYKGLKYVGGANPPERGRDLIFYEFDEILLERRHMAAQVKKGNIDAALADRILGQIDEAFNHPHTDPQTGLKVKICQLFIVASGKIQDNVMERIRVERSLLHPNIRFMNGEQILQNERATASDSIRVTRAEKLIHTLGLDKLFVEKVFKEKTGEAVAKMFQIMNFSQLRVTAELPAFLYTLPEIKDRIVILPIADQREVLHCLSIIIVAESNFNYGAIGKYGIWRVNRAGT